MLPNPSAGARELALAALAAGLIAVVASAADGAWAGGRAPAPFAWADVAAVHLGCAVPLALAAALAATRFPPRLAAAFAGGLLAVGLTTAAVGPAAVSGVVLRPAVAAAVTTGVVIAAAVYAGRRADGDRPAWRRAGVPAVLGAAALVVPPATFIDARCRHDLAQLGELMDQSRVGEARALAGGLAVLDPGREWRGRPVSEVAADLDRAATDLERRVAVPLRDTATTRDRVDRGTALAMLGRTGEALDALRAVDDPRAAAVVWNLRGTIHEARGEWDDGLAAYRTGRTAWEARPAGPARDAGVLWAATGAAYCLRKAGRYAEAGDAYREVLALAPTADSHFLLARFYDDAQQTGPAREHARRAMALAPDRYGETGGRLVARLAVYQFGCLGVFDAESASGAGAVGAGQPR